MNFLMEKIKTNDLVFGLMTSGLILAPVFCKLMINGFLSSDCTTGQCGNDNGCFDFTGVTGVSQSPKNAPPQSLLTPTTDKIQR